MRELIAVFIGSGLGGISRYGLGSWVNSWHNQYFPYGTLVVNVVACFILGFVVGLADHKQIISSTVRLFLTVGFCGGFSTFSTFSNDTLTLFQQGYSVALALYVFGSVLLCVAATFCGLFIAWRF